MAFVFMKARSRVNKRANTKTGEEILRRLRDFLDNSAGEPIEILCGFWGDEQKALTYQEIRQVILSGDINDDLAKQWANDYTYMLTHQFTPYWEEAMKAGAVSQPIMDPISNIFSFDTTRPGVVNWIKDHGAELVTNSTNTQIEGIRYLLGESVRNTYGMDELARLIRPCVGLYRGQVSAAEKYYSNIKNTLTEDHPRMSAESIERKALEATTKYAEKMHRYRADMIAQTEMAYAYNRGADEGIRQAQQDYLIGKVVMRWSTSGDDRVCDTCQALEGQVVGLEEHFSVSGTRYSDGDYDLPPAHPNCACAVEYEEVEGEAGLRQPDRDYDNLEGGQELLDKYDAAGSAEEQMSDINDFLDTYSSFPSKWSGNVYYTNSKEQAGWYERDTHDIYLNPKAGVKTRIHELLHSRSVYDDTGIISSSINGVMNEATVEYYAQQICSDSGIEFPGRSYKKYVDKLKEIASICDMDGLDFGRSLFHTPYSLRHEKLKAIVKKREKELNISGEDQMRLRQLVKDLKGPKSKLKKVKPRPVEQTNIATTAQELIDLIEAGWSTEEEFVYIYSMIVNADLSDEESEKFIDSGMGNEILESPLVGSIVDDTPLKQGARKATKSDIIVGI